MPKNSAYICNSVSGFSACYGVRGNAPVAKTVDFTNVRPCSPSPVKNLAADPMVSEAAICTPRKDVRVHAHAPDAAVHSFDCWPRRGQASWSRGRGFVGAALHDEFDLIAGLGVCTGPRPLSSGPEVVFGSVFCDEPDNVERDVGREVDVCLARLEDVSHQTPVGVQSTTHFPQSPVPCEELDEPRLDGCVGADEPISSAAIDGELAPNDGRSVEGTLPHQQVRVAADEFISALKKPLQQPILPTTPKPRKTRSERARELSDAELIPKRSIRLAKKSKNRAPRPEAQARKVMMK